ncbi:MAG: terminase small subunit protein [Bacteroidota bacterium]
MATPLPKNNLPTPPKKNGRPSKYSKEVCDKICEILSTSSKGLVTICKSDDMPHHATVMRWLATPENKEFCDNYTRAREDQADFLADEIIQISDDATNDFMTVTKGEVQYEIENKEWTSRSKLRVDARKWKASKLAPKKYGDKVQTEHSGAIGITQITGMEIK